nr:MAG TPA: hypothetical protein [Caudoviricetes sp.]
MIFLFFYISQGGGGWSSTPFFVIKQFEIS